MNKTYIQTILPQVIKPSDILSLSAEELNILAAELRREIIETVSQNGGHLAPSLGVVELTLALLKEFNPEQDKLIWDVGHQAYAYKLLTGRQKLFSTLRSYGGISGFPKMSESIFDHFGTGHASTSISAALGMAIARDLAKKNHHVLAIIGDGSISSGLAFEALNQAGQFNRPFIVVLNDNEMSIAKNVGALSLFMSRHLSASWVQWTKREIKNLLRSLPKIGNDAAAFAKRGEVSFKNFFTPGILFEALGFTYIGPADGHNLSEVTELLRLAKASSEPVLLHVLTKKGKGYPLAEENPSRFHGLGPFNIESGEFEQKSSSTVSFTSTFGEALVDLAKNDEKIIAITAAMPDGTGLNKFSKIFPTRFFDVGICESHAVTLAAGLATQGLKPVVAVYSTFMQRAYDQVLHDVCLQNLPVLFCLDRAGLVGEDGPTHHGVYDMSYLRHIPNLCVLCPRHEQELVAMLNLALLHNAPVAIRYPRGSSGCSDQSFSDIIWGQGEFMQEGQEIAVIFAGSLSLIAFEVAKQYQEQYGSDITIFNARFLKPLPDEQILNIINTHEFIIILEEHALAGGFSSAVLECLLDKNKVINKQIKRIGIADEYITHGDISTLLKQIGLDAENILKEILLFKNGSF